MLVGAGKVLRERADAAGVAGVQVHELGEHAALGQAQRRFHGIGEALLDAFLDHQPVHHHLNGVLERLLQLGRFGELDLLAVHLGAGVALGREFLEQLNELALAVAHHGGQHLEAGALGHLQQLVNDLLRRLLGNGLPADGAVRCAHPGPQQAHVVVDLGDGAHGGARVLDWWTSGRWRPPGTGPQ